MAAGSAGAVVGAGAGAEVVVGEELGQLQEEPVQLQPVPRKQACSGVSEVEGGV